MKKIKVACLPMQFWGSSREFDTESAHNSLYFLHLRSRMTAFWSHDTVPEIIFEIEKCIDENQDEAEHCFYDLFSEINFSKGKFEYKHLEPRCHWPPMLALSSRLWRCVVKFDRHIKLKSRVPVNSSFRSMFRPGKNCVLRKRFKRYVFRRASNWPVSAEPTDIVKYCSVELQERTGTECWRWVDRLTSVDIFQDFASSAI